MVASLERILLTAAVLATAVVLFGGCGAAPRSRPVAASTWSCTPDGSGEPCTEQKASAQAEEAEAYAEAMHAYREFTKERSRLLNEGGTPTATAVLTRYATDGFLADIESELSVAYESALYSTGQILIPVLVPESFTEERVALLACEDASQLRIYNSTGDEAAVGVVGAVRLIATGEPGERSISDSESAEGVLACD